VYSFIFLHNIETSLSFQPATVHGSTLPEMYYQQPFQIRGIIAELWPSLKHPTRHSANTWLNWQPDFLVHSNNALRNPRSRGDYSQNRPLCFRSSVLFCPKRDSKADKAEKHKRSTMEGVSIEDVMQMDVVKILNFAKDHGINLAGCKSLEQFRERLVLHLRVMRNQYFNIKVCCACLAHGWSFHPLTGHLALVLFACTSQCFSLQSVSAYVVCTDCFCVHLLFIWLFLFFSFLCVCVCLHFMICCRFQLMWLEFILYKLKKKSTNWEWLYYYYYSHSNYHYHICCCRIFLNV